MQVDPHPAAAAGGALRGRRDDRDGVGDVAAQRLQRHEDQPHLGEQVLRTARVGERWVGHDDGVPPVARPHLRRRARGEGEHRVGGAHEDVEGGVVGPTVVVVRVAQVVHRENERDPGLPHGRGPRPQRRDVAVVVAEVDMDDVGLLAPPAGSADAVRLQRRVGLHPVVRTGRTGRTVGGAPRRRTGGGPGR